MTEPDLVIEMASGGKLRFFGGMVNASAPIVKPACETCRFWDAARAVVGPPLPDDSPWIMSACRRRAPQASVNWPKVLSTDWCGEYEEAAQAVK